MDGVFVLNMDGVTQHNTLHLCYVICFMYMHITHNINSRITTIVVMLECVECRKVCAQFIRS